VFGATAPMSYEYDVFLSHATVDQSLVETIARRLMAEAELQPFLHRWHLIPGEPMVPAIERALERSETVAVFFGSEGESAWRDQESQLALILQAERRVIPVLLPGASRADVRGFLRVRTWVDLDDDDGFSRLIAGITGRAPELVNDFDPGAKLRRRLSPSRRSRRRDATKLAEPLPYRVFVSSTLCDDEAHRTTLLETIAPVGMVPVGIESVPEGAGTPTLEARRHQLESCDLVLVLVAWRYGQIHEGCDRSRIELEYQWAKDHGVPRLVLLIDEERPVVVTRDFDDPQGRWVKQAQLQDFKARLMASEPTVPFAVESIGRIVTHLLHQWRTNGASTMAGAADWLQPRDAGAPEVEERGAEQEQEQREEQEQEQEQGEQEREEQEREEQERGAEQERAATPRKRSAKSSRRGSRKPRARRSSLRQLSRYLEAVEHDNTTATMLGPATSLPTPLHPDDLRVKVRLSPSHAPTRGEGEEASGSGVDVEAEADAALELHEVFERAERRGCRVVTLVGPPGSGKSTHLRRVVLWLSRRSAKSLGLPLDTVPVLLSLNELPPGVESLREAIAARLGQDERLGAPLVDALLERDHLLVLVDGLDELGTDARREPIDHWLDQGLRELPEARFVVAHRPAEPGASPAWTSSMPVLEVQLPPLDDTDARAIIDRWYGAMAPEGDTGRAEALRQAEALWAQLEAPEFRATRMFELTRNPLMLTVLCVVHHQRGRLPTRRVELYEQCLQVLVHQWCSRGALPRRFGEREARQVLQPLAHWLHEEHGRTNAEARSLARVIEPPLAEALGVDSVDAVGFLRAAGAGPGIVAARGNDRYGLLHPCLQEYLCARHLRSLSHGDPAVLDGLAVRFGDPWWREVTLSLLALGEPPLFEALMRRVVRCPGFVAHPDWAVECMREGVGSTVAPFVELLEEPPGEDRAHWERQHAAAEVLEKIDPERLEALLPRLADHPFAPLRRRAGPAQGPGSVTRVSPRSGVVVVEIPAGPFSMGSHHRERGRRGGEGPRHVVELPRFAIGKVPVTNEEYGHYLRLCPGARAPAYWGDPRYDQPRQPVVGVSWHDAMAYCAWAGLTLPTEAQWERAARGDTKTAYWSGRKERDLHPVGWFAGNSGERLHPAGELEANPFGLYDVHGNVWEWCLDGFGDYDGHAPRASDGLRHDPSGSDNRVIRGGSFLHDASRARSAYRLNRHADDRVAYLGFRVVERLEPEPEHPDDDDD